MFTLLGRDPDAPMLIRLWASIRARSGERPEKVAEAMHCANAMEAYREAPITPNDRAALDGTDVDRCARPGCGDHRKIHGDGICEAVHDDVLCQCDGFVEPEVAR